MDFICEPLYEHLVHQEHLEYLRQLEAKETNNIDNNGPIWTSLDPMLEGRVRMSFSWFPAPKKPRNGFNFEQVMQKRKLRLQLCNIRHFLGIAEHYGSHTDAII